LPKILITERDRYRVRKLCWDRVRYLQIPRKDRMLLATELEMDFWDAWRKQQEKED